MNIVFKRIYAQNFRSINNMGMEFIYNPDDRMTLIGSLDNGAGKSTLAIHSLYYVLFDKAYNKNNNKTCLINSRSNKNCLVSVEFTCDGKEYKVTRGMKPTIFEIECDGIKIDDPASLKDHQENLVSITGIDEITFNNIIALGKDRFQNFADMSQGDIRSYCDKMLDLNVFTRMKEKNKQDIKAKDTLLSNKRHEVSVLDQKINGLNAIIDLKKQKKHEFNAQLERDLELLIKEVMEYQSSIDTQKEQCALLQDQFKKEEDYKRKTDSMKNLLVQLESDKRIKEEGIKTEHKVKLEGIKSTLNSLTQDLFYLEKELKTTQEQKINDLKKSLRDIESSIASEKKTILSNVELYDRNINNLTCHACGSVLSTLDEIKKNNQYLLDHNIEIRKGIDQLERQAVDIRLLIIQEESSIVDDWLKQRPDVLSSRESIKKEITEHQESLDRLNGYTFDDMLKNHSDLSLELQELNQRIDKGHALVKERSLADAEYQKAKDALDEANKKLNVLDGMFIAKTHQADSIKKEIEKEKELAKSQTLNDWAIEESELQNQSVLKNSILYDIDTLEVYIRHHKIMDKALSDDGAKTNIIRQYIPILNKHIKRYLESMNVMFDIHLTDEFDVELCSVTRKNQKFSSLSSGQQCRVNIAIMLAWRDISKQLASCNVNLLILDEVLENLSEEGVAAFSEMWRNTQQDLNLYVITQRLKEFDGYFDKTIVYQLVDDSTELYSLE